MPVYKFSKISFSLWMEEIENYIKKKELGVYAENAFNDIQDVIKLVPLFFKDELCMEVDDSEDLKVAKERLN